MNKPRCQFDKRKNCVCFALCSPSPVQKATPKPAVKGEQSSCTLPLTAEFCVVLQTKATGSKSKRNTAQSKPYCSPEQKRKSPCAVCGVCRLKEKTARRMPDRHAKAVCVARGLPSPHALRVGLLAVFCDTLGWVVLAESHLSITGGYLLTEPQKIKIKGRTCL